MGDRRPEPQHWWLGGRRIGSPVELIRPEYQCGLEDGSQVINKSELDASTVEAGSLTQQRVQRGENSGIPATVTQRVAANHLARIFGTGLDDVLGLLTGG